jgi:predicted phage terminase large subunit-like protein
MFSLEELKAKREEMGRIAFLAQMQNDASTMQEGNLVQESWIQYFTTDKSHAKEDVPYVHLEGEDIKWFTGIDFAVGGKSGDYSAIVTIAYDTKSKHIYVVDSFIKRISVAQFKAEIKRHCDRYKQYYTQVFAEANGFQYAIWQDLHDMYSGLNIKPVKNTKNKEQRFIAALSPRFENMKVYINKSCAYNEILVNQLIALTPTGSPTHDDAPDALCMCLEKIRENSGVKVTDFS